jgi:asparaginyl-tRNA synthetase
MNYNIKQLFTQLELKNIPLHTYNIYGWVRTVRSSSNILGFCVLNDGSNVNGIQIVLSIDFIPEDKIATFFKNASISTYIKCYGNIVESPAIGQKYEMQLIDFEIYGKTCDGYPLAKSKMNLDTLREYVHLRGRTNTFGSIFRIRSSLTKIIHDFYHSEGFLHLDPNIITINECEGGAGVFQVTENDISKPRKLKIIKNTENYDWNSDHFNNPVYLTVSSQLQLEALACSLGNVYTMNKSFRSEHSCTCKHVSEFTHLEIEMININMEDLMNISEKMLKYAISQIFLKNNEDLVNLDKFISKGLIEKLRYLENCEYKRMSHREIVENINNDIDKDPSINIPKLEYDDDLGSVHENYITKKYNCPIFLTHWPIKIKSFYMKQCDDNETCESFDLLLPYGIGELIGASMREDNYDKLVNMMNIKNVDPKHMDFYLDLRRFGSCPHGGFGLGFDRLVMLFTGMTNIRDVIPFPVYYKGCKY